MFVGPANISQLFRIADKDGNGKLDKAELKEALTTLGFSHLGDAAIDGIFARADNDGNAEIDFEEFMVILSPTHTRFARSETFQSMGGFTQSFHKRFTE